jgi:hypothetical protein
MRSWRWAGIDPEGSGLGTAVEVGPGDVLYIPPGTLHHVRSLTMAMSFNIDWHTAASALRGVTSVLEGAPWKNGYYNLVSLLGLAFGVPEKLTYRYYKSYLDYVS